MSIQFKPSTIYHAHHTPSGENWVLLGVDTKGGGVCAAGWPPTIGRLEDCEDFEEQRPITHHELVHRSKYFGDNWD